VYKLLVIGGSWHGSNCAGLAWGFRSLGHAVELVASDYYIPNVGPSVSGRAMQRVLAPVFIKQFNLEIVRAVARLRPDIVVVFKGNYVQPETLARIRASGTWLVNFYPDNSFMTHAYLDTAIFKYFDHIFTTKRFGIGDFKRKLGLTQVSFLPHGYDPNVHRPFTDQGSIAQWACDVSFIGTWSPHKERLLSALRSKLNPGQLRIWGGYWEKCTSPAMQDCIVGEAVLGDLYALAISASKINLGLLSEKRSGASDDDQITSRTFHIPASGGFLLHERTDEVAEYFVEGGEMGCFSSEHELIDKVEYYLSNDVERRRIAHAGYERCVAENSLSHRAQAILDKYRERQNRRVVV
jgi:spore maturation protein CgeB